MTTMTVDRPAAGSVTGRATRPAPNLLTAPLAGRTWREQGYLALVLLLAPFAFTYVIFAVSFTAGIAVTVIGLFVAGAVGWGYTPRRGRVIWGCARGFTRYRAQAGSAIVFP
jgi:hypothetical protein